jgi:3-hydroxyacyl-CoA dehydrogenase
MKEHGHQPASWVEEMLAAGHTSFYKIENGIQYYYDIPSKSYLVAPGRESFIILDHKRSQTPVFKNTGCTVHDIGDAVLCVEFQTKMNTIGGEVLEGINKALDIAEADGWKGVVLGNNAPNFSAGANLAIVLMQAIEKEWDELNFAVRHFQNTVMRLRYSSIPVVAAPHGLTLGGGCEMSMHTDACMAAAETYIGLVEVGVGVIPGGGGSKEFALRLSDSFGAEDTWIPKLSERFTTIATAKTATSAYEAFDLGIFTKDKDAVVFNPDRAISSAKEKVLELYDAGYTKPMMRHDILVLGRTGLAALYAGIASFQLGKYASAHDALISKKLAYVLEREAFLSLCGEKKTLERMQSILTSGKPLRN